jgi:hypothetical protein
MQNSINPFSSITGSEKLAKPQFFVLLFTVAVISAWMISYLEIGGAFILLFLPVAVTFLFFLFRYPVLGLYTALIYSFMALGLGRYISGVEFAMLLDVMFFLTYIAFIFNRFNEGIDLSPAKKDITLLSALWFGYTLLEIVNPEAHSVDAWISGRSIGMHMMLIVPLTLLLFNDNRKLDIFLYIWAGFSILVTLKGIMQVTMGADQWEVLWLNKGNAKTHVLFGRLRAFSFLSDAGQFGANQAYSGVVASIVATAMKDWRKKLFFIIVALFAFYGMVISGTRGALSIPIVGFAAYFFLRKNKMVMILGFFMLLVVFYFFKFTTIGQSNYNIRRMRSAFDVNDPSLQVRLRNQRILKDYMASRPIGGGLGLGGVKAQKFKPNAFLSQIPTDSWYVLIWVELGVIGLVLHLLILIYVLAKSSFRIMFRIRDPILKIKMTALTAGMLGIMVSSYGNAVLGQMPTSVLIYISIALMMNSEALDKDNTESLPETLQKELNS